MTTSNYKVAKNTVEYYKSLGEQPITLPADILANLLEKNLDMLIELEMTREHSSKVVVDSLAKGLAKSGVRIVTPEELKDDLTITGNIITDAGEIRSLVISKERYRSKSEDTLKELNRHKDKIVDLNRRIDSMLIKVPLKTSSSGTETAAFTDIVGNTLDKHA